MSQQIQPVAVPSSAAEGTPSVAPIDGSTAQARLAEAVGLIELGNRSAARTRLVELARQVSETTEPALREVLARSLLHLGLLLSADGINDLALAALDRVIDELGDVTSCAVEARFAKADLLRKGNDKAATLACYDQACSAARQALPQHQNLQGLLASGLLCLGELQSECRHVAESVAAFDEVIARFGREDNAHLAQAVHARYNRAVVLRDAGSSEAATAYRGVADDYSTSSNEAIQRFAALATYNLGVLQIKSGDLRAAVESFDRMSRHFAATQDPVVLVRLGKALYFRAECLAAAGGFDASLDAYSDVVQRFASEGDDVIKLIVAGARRRLRLLRGWAEATFNGASMIPYLDPAVRLLTERSDGAGVGDVLNIIEHPAGLEADQPLTLRQAVDAVREPRYEAPDDADPETRTFAVRRNLLLEQLERDLQGHLRCGAILRNYLDRCEPFALYLRNFDLEGCVAAGQEEGRPVRISLQLSDDDDVEERVVATLGCHVPFIGVSNNAPLRPGAHAIIPRMMLRNDGWQEVVEELIGAAAVIVVHAVRLTPGLSWELVAMERIGAADRTVIVLSNARGEGVTMATIAGTYLGAAGSPGRPVLASDTELMPFRRVIQDSELVGDVLSCSWAADLLVPVRELRALDPRARPRWDGVTL